MTTASTVRMVRRGTPLAEAAANRRSRRGALRPDLPVEDVSTGVSLITVVGPRWMTRLARLAVPGPPLFPASTSGTGSESSTEGLPEPSVSSSTGSATQQACQVQGCRSCQHDGDGGQAGTCGEATASPMVAPRAVRPSRGPTERGHGARLPVHLLRRPPAPGQPPGRGQLAGPHQPRLPGPRRPVGDRGPGRLHPAHPCGTPE
jgi:hypothetical protein